MSHFSQDPQWSEQPKRKRKRTKRYVGSDDDDSLVADADLAAETSVVDNPRRRIAEDRPIPTTSKHDSPLPSVPTPQQLPPKKQKLPTIKKVKLPNLNPSTSSSTVVTNAPVIPLVGKSTQDGVRKTLNGTIDIDLLNKSIYEEIFSKTVRVAVNFLFDSCSCFYRAKEMEGHHELGATAGLKRKKDGKN